MDYIYPRLRFGGDSFAKLAGVIFCETLKDLVDKFDDGTSGGFPRGYLHTSTYDHPETPCYYKSMWSRDAGRGLIELSRMGFSGPALDIARYFISHINCGDHWGRCLESNDDANELDGNALALLGVCAACRSNGSEPELAAEFSRGLAPVIGWAERLINGSPYDGLMPSQSELSGNPCSSFPVYGIYGNYGMAAAIAATEKMARAGGDGALADKCVSLGHRLNGALNRLISDGKFSKTAVGVWINGIDGRDGSAFDMSDWCGRTWPCWHWTRQVPFILDCDASSSPARIWRTYHWRDGQKATPRHFGYFDETNAESYAFLRKYMNSGEYFRRWGFVSNTGWSGMFGRHDETMCGYGQGFYTQAALIADDVNSYGKCLEGVVRLGYDGNVVEHMAHEMNPFIMHECFSYENYADALDHTFGALSNGETWLMDNPGDEGNLVQETEILKAFELVAGIYSEDGKLIIMPRLPWLWDKMDALDFAVPDKHGKLARVNVTVRHERWRRRETVLVSGEELGKRFDGLEIRFGPFARWQKDITGLSIEQSGNATWVWRGDCFYDRENVLQM